MARRTATRLIAHACCCGASDKEESALLISVDSVSGRALHRFVGSAGGGSSMLLRSLNCCWLWEIADDSDMVQ